VAELPSWDEAWFADTVERLFLDFEHDRPLGSILDVVRQCRAELNGSGLPASALPEMVERLARQRLLSPPAQTMT